MSDSQALSRLLRPRQLGRAPAVIAHRGGSLLAPENTLPAIRIAKDLHVDAIEIDVRMGRDGTVMVMHDATLQRTSTGSGEVSRVSRAVLRQADAGVKFDRRFHRTRIPTLGEALAAARPTPLIIEAKDESVVGLAAAEVVRRKAWERAAVMSFHTPAVARAAKAHPRVTFGHLVKLGWQGRWERVVQETVFQAVAIGAAFVCVDVKGCSFRLVRAAHQNHLPVWVWTVDRWSVADRLISGEVDGLISNQPHLMLARAAQWTEWMGHGG